MIDLFETLYRFNKNRGIAEIDFQEALHCILLVSTHVVCERLSAMHYLIPVTRIFGSKFLDCPHSVKH